MSEDPKCGSVWRHREHGWTVEVETTSMLPCVDDASFAEWSVRFMSEEHGLGQLPVAKFLEKYERVDVN